MSKRKKKRINGNNITLKGLKLGFSITSLISANIVPILLGLGIIVLLVGILTVFFDPTLLQDPFQALINISVNCLFTPLLALGFVADLLLNTTISLLLLVLQLLSGLGSNLLALALFILTVIIKLLITAVFLLIVVIAIIVTFVLNVVTAFITWFVDTIFNVFNQILVFPLDLVSGTVNTVINNVLTRVLGANIGNGLVSTGFWEWYLGSDNVSYIRATSALSIGSANTNPAIFDLITPIVATYNTIINSIVDPTQIDTNITVIQSFRLEIYQGLRQILIDSGLFPSIVEQLEAT